jgi:hypothetical protein
MEPTAIRARVDNLGRAKAAGSHPTGAIGHLAVGQGRAVFDHQHALAADGSRIIDEQRRSGFDHHRARVDRAQALAHAITLSGWRYPPC